MLKCLWVIIMFTDTHCHLYDEYYDDINTIIAKSKTNNVNRFINAGCDLASSKEAVNKSNIINNCYCAVGIHPENITKDYNDELKEIEELLSNKNVIAIGEIGLDYYYVKDNKEEQMDLFEKQLALAEKYNLPVVVHSRDAIQDTLDCIKRHKVTGVIHSFSGSYEMAQEFIKRGFALGINGVITFKNCNLKDLYKKIDVNNIVLETDCPYLTPEPNRGKKNDPSSIYEIAKFVSKIYEISVEELCDITNKTIKRIFDI